jgi:hypothetical protein
VLMLAVRCCGEVRTHSHPAAHLTPLPAAPTPLCGPAGQMLPACCRRSFQGRGGTVPGVPARRRAFYSIATKCKACAFACVRELVRARVWPCQANKLFLCVWHCCRRCTLSLRMALPPAGRRPERQLTGRCATACIRPSAAQKLRARRTHARAGACARVYVLCCTVPHNNRRPTPLPPAPKHAASTLRTHASACTLTARNPCGAAVVAP